jgi:hypothetical protein
MKLMIRLNEGEWAKELALPPARYGYRFVVDGQWADDPAAMELIPDPFGTGNAVVEVPLHATRSQEPLTEAPMESLEAK